MLIIHPHTGQAEELPDPEDDKLPARVGWGKKARPDPGKDPGEPPEQFTRSSDRKPASRNKSSATSAKSAPERSAKSYAIWLLSRRDYSAAGLRGKLAARGYPDDEIEQALGFVIDNKYQSDARYAEQRSRGAETRAGNARIEMTLRQKGIAPELAKDQVRQLAPEEERVIQAAAKYRQQVAKEGMTQKMEARIYRFLAYRGFSSKAIRVAIQDLRGSGNND